MKPLLSASEAARLDALRRYQILDTAPELAFDDITKMAAFICGTPVALMTLVDDKRQWFKSKVGVGSLSESPRDHAFCAHTILAAETLIVDDLLLDTRFAENPFVTGVPHVRFYAGAPLLTADGLALGSVCVLDMKPRQLSPEQKETLERLSRIVMTTLELRRTSFELAEAAANLKTLTGLLPICSFCREVRNDEGYWEQVEGYVQAHTEATFSQGICPKCSRMHFPSFDFKRG